MGGASKTLWLVKEARQERLDIIWFHYMKCPERAKLQIQKADEGLPGAGGGEEGWLQTAMSYWNVPGGPVVENLPTNTGNTSLIPGWRRSHMPQSTWHNYWAWVAWGPRAAMREPMHPNKKIPHDAVTTPCATTKTQCSQINKQINIKNEKQPWGIKRHDRNVLQWIVMMVAQLSTFTKNH